MKNNEQLSPKEVKLLEIINDWLSLISAEIDENTTNLLTVEFLMGAQHALERVVREIKEDDSNHRLFR